MGQSFNHIRSLTVQNLFKHYPQLASSQHCHLCLKVQQLAGVVLLLLMLTCIWHGLPCMQIIQQTYRSNTCSSLPLHQISMIVMNAQMKPLGVAKLSVYLVPHWCWKTNQLLEYSAGSNCTWLLTSWEGLCLTLDNVVTEETDSFYKKGICLPNRMGNERKINMIASWERWRVSFM